MNSSLTISLLLITLVVLSCSSIFENENNEVVARLNNDELKIENGSNRSIYYFAVDQNILALINWAPHSSEENEIPARSSINVQTADIFGYEEGHNIVVYYWFEREAPFNVKSVEVL